MGNSLFIVLRNSFCRFACNFSSTNQIEKFMDAISQSDFWAILTMVLVGALSGTLAARIMKGDTFGFVINALLGIGGGIVGGFLFQALNIEPGSNVVKIINNSYDLSLGPKYIGQIISATVGAIIILFVARFVRGGHARDKR